jgi:tripartite-type tricarboxylate transporter receptor subunit TctC
LRNAPRDDILSARVSGEDGVKFVWSRVVRIAAVVLGGLIVASTGFAQDFPAKPIRMVVPNAVGGLDIYARFFLPRTVETLGQPIVIENRAGASGRIGAESIARSAPDGYSLLFATSAVLVTSPFLSKDLPYDPIKDFTPIGKLLEPVMVLAINASLPVRSVTELIDYAKRNPGKLSYGSSGVGTLLHFNAEGFKLLANVDMLHVPYKGVGQVVPELVAGRIQATFTGISAFGANVATGKIRLLAVLESKRYAHAPDLAAIGEMLPGYRKAPSWFAMFGPAGMPRPVVDRLNGAFVKALADPEVRASLEKLSLAIIASTPEEHAASMKEDIEYTARLVKAIGIKPE